jgi:hypothetical protein
MNVYCEQEDLELMYGVSNIRKWADLDNNGDEDIIVARIDWSCETSTEYINSRLMNGPYEIPFSTGSGGTLPIIIINLAAMYGGMLLYDGRQVVSAKSDERDQLSRQRKDFDRFIRQIFKGQIKLLDPNTQEELPLRDKRYPFVVN